jgi:hypothetical protein
MIRKKKDHMGFMGCLTDWLGDKSDEGEEDMRRRDRKRAEEQQDRE